MKIEVLGTGCPKCVEFEKRVKEAVKLTGVKAEIIHVYDINKIIERNVFATPALAVDGKVVLSGKLPSVQELTILLK
ncbi:TM0996/MTH895 family glutaredoxin-like protein [Candidatus Micrarchaeota archaeon]|nr:TM0996/MTH895 family glutaredoxin-like protein [Candidatus Micrarchaeota archaeon]